MSESVEIICRIGDDKKILLFPHDTTEAVVNDYITSIDLREFLKLEKLERLTLSIDGLGEIDLSPLGEHPALIAFRMEYTKTKRPLDLSKLENCKKLRELRIEHCRPEKPSGLDLSRLPVFPELKVFSIFNSEVANPDIRVLSEYRSLEEVDFGGSLHENLTFHPLSRLPHLKRVLVKGCGAVTIDLAPLATCTELEELVLTGLMFVGLKAIDLAPLSSCKNLRKLNLSEQHFSVIDLSPLKEIPSFEELALHSMYNVKSMSLTPFAECRNLRVLDLSCDFIRKDKDRLYLDFTPLSSTDTLEVLNLKGLYVDLDQLSGLKSIQHLILTRCTLAKVSLSPLSGCSELRTLKLDYAKDAATKDSITAISLRPLSNFRNLEYLDLGVNAIEKIDLTPLANCQKLKKLAINNNPFELLDLQPLESCPELEVLYINNIGLKSIDLSALSNCTNFKILNLESNYLEELDLRPLRACKQLQVVYCQTNRLQALKIDSSSDWSSLILFDSSENRLQEFSLDFLRASVNLERLNLKQNRLVQIDLSPLSRCIRLNRVDISRNNLKKVDLRPLSDLENLEHLYLDNNELNEIDFEPISRMTNLAELGLHSTGLTTVDYDSLSRCKKLGLLDLSDNRIQYLELRRLVSIKNLTAIRAGISGDRHPANTPHIKIPEGFNPESTIFVIPVGGRPNGEMYVDLEQEDLKISKSKFNLDFLAQMKNLTSLTIESTSMSEDDIAKLSTCKRLVSLSLERLNTESPPPPLEYLDLSFLSKMPDLESISIMRVKGLKRIGMDGVAGCKTLRNVKLDLSDTENIDITPLTKCENLRTISISGKKIDVDQAARFRGLESFELKKAKIREVVFESLSECSSLESLNLDEITCEDARIDLNHLSSLSNLSTLNLCIGGLDHLDVTPLTRLSALKEISFRWIKVIGDEFIQFAYPMLAEHVDEFTRPSSVIQEAVGSSGWQKVGSLVETAIQSHGREFTDMWDQRILLGMLGLEELACLDGNVFELFHEIPKEADYTEGLESLKHLLSCRLEEQVKSGGVLIFLDDDGLGKHGLAELARLVRERRAQEIENLVLQLDAMVDLRPLWMTSIGFKSLRELEADLDCSLLFLNTVEKKIGEYGLKLRTSETSLSYSVTASEMMKQYIFERARGHEKRPSDVK